MRTDIVPGSVFPDYELSDHRGKHRALSELQQGDPLVLVPGLAGSWKLLWPLARSLARHFEVILSGLYGDRDGWAGPFRRKSPVRI